MTTDTETRDLLELVARACGLRVWDWLPGHGFAVESAPGRTRRWNPATDDGDALRLAVRSRFHICIFSATEGDGIKTPGFVEIWREGDADPLHVEHVSGADYEAATRFAILRAAAEIGRAMS